MLLTPITKEIFESNNKIYFDRIDKGFDRYTSGILSLPKEDLSSMKEKEKLDLIIKNENKYIEFIRKVYIINKDKPMIDFYLKDIDNKGVLRILDSLDYEDKIIFINHLRYLDKETVYFSIENKNLLPFLTRLSTRELNFCTMYFTSVPITIWGNYNLNFPLFFENEEKLDYYNEIAKDCGLIIRNKVVI